MARSCIKTPRLRSWQAVDLSTTSGGSATGNFLADPTTGQATMLTTSSDIACLYVYDGLDNPVGLITDFATNAITSNFDPYGVGTLSGTGNGVSQNPYSFHSGIQDRASGLVKFGIRWYNPTTGTWTQQDTLDAPLDPTNGNRYVFVGGDPIYGLDPTGNDFLGTSCASEIGLGAVAVVGGIAELGLDGFAGVISATPTLGAGTIAAGAPAVITAGVIAGGVGLIGDGINSCS